MSDDRRERPGYLTPKPTELPEVPWKLPKKESRARNEGLPKIIWSGPKLYKSLQRYRREEWYETVSRFEANPDFYNAYHWLCRHPLFWTFRTGTGAEHQIHEKYLMHEYGMPEGVEITVTRVDPKTDAISEDPARNTQLQIWYEIAFTSWTDIHRTHVYKLDGGAPTYEQAIVKAAKRIHKKYGNDRVAFEKEVEEWRAKSV